MCRDQAGGGLVRLGNLQGDAPVVQLFRLGLGAQLKPYSSARAMHARNVWACNIYTSTLSGA